MSQISLNMTTQTSNSNSNLNETTKKRKLSSGEILFTKPEKATSYVWDYFQVKKDQKHQNKAYCTLCREWKSWGTSTTNLRNHLQRCHSISHATDEILPSNQPTLFQKHYLR